MGQLVNGSEILPRFIGTMCPQRMHPRIPCGSFCLLRDRFLRNNVMTFFIDLSLIDYLPAR